MPPKQRGHNLTGRDKLFRNAVEHVHVGVGHIALGNVTLNLAAGPPPPVPSSADASSPFTGSSLKLISQKQYDQELLGESAFFTELNEQLLSVGSLDYKRFRHEVLPLSKTKALFDHNVKRIAQKLLLCLMNRPQDCVSVSEKKPVTTNVSAPAENAEGFAAFARLTVAFARDAGEKFLAFFESFHSVLNACIYDARTGHLIPDANRLQMVFLVQVSWLREMLPYIVPVVYKAEISSTNEGEAAMELESKRKLIERIIRAFVMQMRDTKPYIRRLAAECLAALARQARPLTAMIVEVAAQLIDEDRRKSQVDAGACKVASPSEVSMAAEAGDEMAEDAEEEEVDPMTPQHISGKSDGAATSSTKAWEVYVKNVLAFHPITEGLTHFVAELLRGMRGSLSTHFEVFHAQLLEVFHLTSAAAMASGGRNHENITFESACEEVNSAETEAACLLHSSVASSLFVPIGESRLVVQHLGILALGEATQMVIRETRRLHQQLTDQRSNREIENPIEGRKRSRARPVTGDTRHIPADCSADPLYRVVDATTSSFVRFTTDVVKVLRTLEAMCASASDGTTVSNTREVASVAMGVVSLRVELLRSTVHGDSFLSLHDSSTIKLLSEAMGAMQMLLALNSPLDESQQLISRERMSEVCCGALNLLAPLCLTTALSALDARHRRTVERELLLPLATQAMDVFTSLADAGVLQVNKDCAVESEVSQAMWVATVDSTLFALAQDTLEKNHSLCVIRERDRVERGLTGSGKWPEGSSGYDEDATDDAEDECDEDAPPQHQGSSRAALMSGATGQLFLTEIGHFIAHRIIGYFMDQANSEVEALRTSKRPHSISTSAAGATLPTRERFQPTLRQHVTTPVLRAVGAARKGLLLALMANERVNPGAATVLDVLLTFVEPKPGAISLRAVPGSGRTSFQTSLVALLTAVGEQYCRAVAEKAGWGMWQELLHAALPLFTKVAEAALRGQLDNTHRIDIHQRFRELIMRVLRDTRARLGSFDGRTRVSTKGSSDAQTWLFFTASATLLTHLTYGQQKTSSEGMVIIKAARRRKRTLAADTGCITAITGVGGDANSPSEMQHRQECMDHFEAAIAYLASGIHSETLRQSNELGPVGSDDPVDDDSVALLQRGTAAVLDGLSVFFFALSTKSTPHHPSDETAADAAQLATDGIVPLTTQQQQAVKHLCSIMKKDTQERLVHQLLLDSLASRWQFLRVLALRLLKQFCHPSLFEPVAPTKDTVSGSLCGCHPIDPSFFDALLQAEQFNPLSSTGNYDGLQQALAKLSFAAAAGSITNSFQRLILSHAMIGLLHLKFADAWKIALRMLSDLVRWESTSYGCCIDPVGTDTTADGRKISSAEAGEDSKAARATCHLPPVVWDQVIQKYARLLTFGDVVRHSSHVAEKFGRAAGDDDVVETTGGNDAVLRALLDVDAGLSLYTIRLSDSQRHERGELVSRAFAGVSSSFGTAAGACSLGLTGDNEILSWGAYAESALSRQTVGGGATRIAVLINNQATDRATLAKTFLGGLSEMVKHMPRRDRRVELVELLLRELVNVDQGCHPSGLTHLRGLEERIVLAMRACLAAPGIVPSAAVQNRAERKESSIHERGGRGAASDGDLHSRAESLKQAMMLYLSHTNSQLQRAAAENLKHLRVAPYSVYLDKLLPFTEPTPATFRFLSTFHLETEVPEVDRAEYVAAAIALCLPKLNQNVAKEKKKDQAVLGRRVMAFLTTLTSSDELVQVLDSITRKILLTHVTSGHGSSFSDGAEKRLAVAYDFVASIARPAKGTAPLAAAQDTPQTERLSGGVSARRIEQMFKQLIVANNIMAQFLSAVGKRFSRWAGSCFIISLQSYLVACRHILLPAIELALYDRLGGATLVAPPSEVDGATTARRDEAEQRKLAASLATRYTRAGRLSKLAMALRKGALNSVLLLNEQFPGECMGIVEALQTASPEEDLLRRFLCALYENAKGRKLGDETAAPPSPLAEAESPSTNSALSPVITSFAEPVLRLVGSWLRNPTMYPLLAAHGNIVNAMFGDTFGGQALAIQSTKSQRLQLSQELVYKGLQCLADILLVADQEFVVSAGLYISHASPGTSTTLRETFVKEHIDTVFDFLYRLIMRGSATSVARGNMVAFTAAAGRGSGAKVDGGAGGRWKGAQRREAMGFNLKMWKEIMQTVALLSDFVGVREGLVTLPAAEGPPRSRREVMGKLGKLLEIALKFCTHPSCVVDTETALMATSVVESLVAKLDTVSTTRHYRRLALLLNVVTIPAARLSLCRAFKDASTKLDILGGQGSASHDETAETEDARAVMRQQLTAVARVVSCLNSFENEESCERYDFELRFHTFTSLHLFFANNGNYGALQGRHGARQEASGVLRDVSVGQDTGGSGERPTAVRNTHRRERNYSGGHDVKIPLHKSTLPYLLLEGLFAIAANVMFFIRDPERTIRSMAVQVLHALVRYAATQPHQNAFAFLPLGLGTTHAIAGFPVNTTRGYGNSAGPSDGDEERMDGNESGDDDDRDDGPEEADVHDDPPAIAVEEASGSASASYSDAVLGHVIRTTVLPSLRRGVVAKDVHVRLDHMSSFGALARHYGAAFPSFAALYSVNSEQNFFTNVGHVQHRCRLNALAQLRLHCAELNIRDLMRVFVPFLLVAIKDFSEGKRDLQNLTEGRSKGYNDAVLTTVATIASCLPWEGYHHLITMLLSSARDNDANVTLHATMLRGVVKVLEQFHFLGQKEHTHGTDDSATIAGNATRKPTRSRSERIIHTLESDILPQLYHYISGGRGKRGASAAAALSAEVTRGAEHTVDALKRDADDAVAKSLSHPRVQLPVVVAISKVARHLTEEKYAEHLDRLLDEVIRKLRTKNDAVRESARKILCAMMAEAGPGKLRVVISKLRDNFVHGYQLHVLGYTLVSLLIHLYEPVVRPSRGAPKAAASSAAVESKEAALPARQGIAEARTAKEYATLCLTNCLDQLMAIFIDGYLGEIGEQKDQVELMSTMVEVKTNRSLQGFVVLAKHCNASEAMNAFVRCVKWALCPPLDEETQAAPVGAAFLTSFGSGSGKYIRGQKNATADIHFVNKVRLLAVRVARGLMTNPTLQLDQSFLLLRDMLRRHNELREQKIREFEAKDGTRRIRGAVQMLTAERNKSFRDRYEDNFAIQRRPERADVDFLSHTVVATQQKQKLRAYRGRYGKTVSDAAKDFSREDPTTAVTLDTLDEFCLKFLLSVLRRALGVGKEKKYSFAEAAQQNSDDDSDKEAASIGGTGDGNDGEHGEEAAGQRDPCGSDAEEESGSLAAEEDDNEDLEVKSVDEDDEFEQLVGEEQEAYVGNGGPSDGDGVSLGEDTEEAPKGGDAEAVQSTKPSTRKFSAATPSRVQLAAAFTAKHRELLESLVVVVLNTLEGEGSDAVVSNALDVLHALLTLRPPLRVIREMDGQVFGNVTMYFGRGGPIKQRAMRVAAAVVTHQQFVLSDKQATFLCDTVRTEVVERSPFLSMSLSVLLAVVSKHAHVVEVYDLIPLVTELLVHVAYKKLIRTRCIAILTRFLTEYRLTREKFRSHLDMYVRNLDYPESVGRLALLELLHALVYRLPTAVLQGEATVLFIPAVATLCHCEWRDCREKASAILKDLARLGGVDVLTPILRQWTAPLTNDGEGSTRLRLGPELRSLAANAMQVWATIIPAALPRGCDAVVDEAQENFFWESCSWSLPAVVAAVLMKQTQPKGTEGQDLRLKSKREVELRCWSLIYFGLRCAEAMTDAAPGRLFPALAPQLVPHVVSKLVSHSHPWVQGAALRWLQKYLYGYVESASHYLTLSTVSIAAAAVAAIGKGGSRHLAALPVQPFVAYIGAHDMSEDGTEVTSAGYSSAPDVLMTLSAVSAAAKKVITLINDSDVQDERYGAFRALQDGARRDVVKVAVFLCRAQMQLCLTAILRTMYAGHAKLAVTQTSQPLGTAEQWAAVARENSRILQNHEALSHLRSLRQQLQAVAAPIIQKGSVATYVVRSTSLIQLFGGLVSLLPQVATCGDFMGELSGAAAMADGREGGATSLLPPTLQLLLGLHTSCAASPKAFSMQERRRVLSLLMEVQASHAVSAAAVPLSFLRNTVVPLVVLGIKSSNVTVQLVNTLSVQAQSVIHQQLEARGDVICFDGEQLLRNLHEAITAAPRTPFMTGVERAAFAAQYGGPAAHEGKNSSREETYSANSATELGRIIMGLTSSALEHMEEKKEIRFRKETRKAVKRSRSIIDAHNAEFINSKRSRKTGA